MTSLTDKFAVVLLQPHQRPPEHAIAWGGGTLVREFFNSEIIRDDAIAKLARADAVRSDAIRAESYHEAELRRVRAENARLTKRIDALESELAPHREAAAKAQQDAEQRRIQHMLDDLPDPDEPASYAPSGELHTLGPTAPDAALPGDPSRPGGGPDPDEPDPVEDQGDLPNAIERGPSSGPLRPRAKLAHPQPTGPQNPAAVSLGSDPLGRVR